MAGQIEFQTDKSRGILTRLTQRVESLKQEVAQAQQQVIVWQTRLTQTSAAMNEVGKLLTELATEAALGSGMDVSRPFEYNPTTGILYYTDVKPVPDVNRGTDVKEEEA